MNTYRITYVIAFALLTLVAACSSPAPTAIPSVEPLTPTRSATRAPNAPTPADETTPTPAAPPIGFESQGSGPRVALLLASDESDRAKTARDLFIDTAIGLTTTVLYAQADNDAGTQKQQVENALAQDVKFLVIQPVDADAAAAYVDAAHKAGAQVIAFDGLINSPDLDLYITHDSTHAGELQAQAALDWMTANSKKAPYNFIFLEGPNGDTTSAAMLRGYYNVLDPFIAKSQVKVVNDASNADWSIQAARKTVTETLVKYKDNIQAILAVDDSLAEGARLGLHDRKLDGKVFVGGAGSYLTNVQALCGGLQQIDILERIEPLAVGAGMTAARLAHGAENPALLQGIPRATDGKTKIGYGDIPTLGAQVKPVTLDTVQGALVQGGVFSPGQLGKCAPPLASSIQVPSVGNPGTFTLWTDEDENDTGYFYLSNLAAYLNDANPQARVSIVSVPPDQLAARLEKVAPGDAPDLVWGTQSVAQELGRQGIIDSTALRFDPTRFTDASNTGARVEGQQFGVPISNQNFEMLYYNKKLLKEPPADTDALVKLATTLTKKDGSQWTLVFDESDPAMLIPWLTALNGSVLGSDAHTATLNTPEMVSALTFLKDLKDKKVIPPEMDAKGADNLFKTGKAAMIINGTWALADYQKTLGSDLAAARIPKLKATDQFPSPYMQTKYFMLPKSASGAQLDTARAFVDMVLSKGVQLDLTNRLKRLPTLKDAVADPVIANSPVLKGAADQASLGIPEPGTLELVCIWDSIRPNLQALISGKLEPAPAAQAMQTSAEACY